jgi:hypothetical protein
VNFLSIDQHISVCADIRYIFNRLGHTVREVSLSGHAAVINRPSGERIVPTLVGDGWCATIHGRKFKEFYELYAREFDKYDAFICCYPPIFSMLYKYFNKPIIIQIPVRYECGADCTPDLWEEFNEYLREGVDKGKIILCANNIYDQKYAEGFIKRSVRYIPSLCEYTGMSFNPVYDQFLYFSYFTVKDMTGRMVKKHDALKAGHAWQTVADYKGCIHYPYNISTMSTFEQYTAGIPLFFPTKRYIMEMFLNNIPILHQISWQQCIQNGTPRSLIPCPFEFDPNNYRDYNCVAHWLNYADFYGEDMKCIKHFDSVEERDMLLDLNKKSLLAISDEMLDHNEKRKRNVYEKWNNVINGIG